jgi:hypothetical protein
MALAGCLLVIAFTVSLRPRATPPRGAPVSA